MSREQKMSWFMLGAFGLAVIAFGVLLPIIGWPAAFAAFGLVGLGGLAPLFFKKQPTDERDKMIARRAALGGAMLSYMVFLLGCLGTWWFYHHVRGADMMPIYILPPIFFSGVIALCVGRSVVVLVLYGREGRHGCE